MPKKRRAFIDRSKAQHFALVHKTRAELEAEEAKGAGPVSKYVLQPVDYGTRAKRETSESEAMTLDEALRVIDVAAESDHVNAWGLPNDGYDYDRHLRAGGGGTFVSATPQQEALNRLMGKATGSAEAAAAAAEQQVEGITLSDAAMDADLAEALFGDAGEELEELNDDFLLQAGGAQEEGVDEWVMGEEEAAAAFDEAEYMAARIAASRQAQAYQAMVDVWSDEDDEDDEDAARDHRRRPLTEVEQRLAEEFDVVMQGYESDDIGELDDPEACVDEGRPFEGGVSHEMEELLDEFLEERRTETVPITFRGVKEGDEGGDAVPIATRAADVLKDVLGDSLAATVPAAESGGATAAAGISTFGEAKTPGEGRDVSKADGRDVSERASDAPAAPGGEGLDADQQDEEEEDEVGDLDALQDIIRRNQPYLQAPEVEEWDCESILSTLSTTDNLPALLQHRSFKAKRKQRQRAQEASLDDVAEGEAYMPGPILLSAKTGIPLGALPGLERQERDGGANLGVARDKTESKDDKRARKAAIKAERRARRMEKKALRAQMVG